MNSEINKMMEEEWYKNAPKVIICRSPEQINSLSSECPTSLISGLHISSISGGTRKPTYRRYLYGYIDYELAHQLVNCSGRHSDFNEKAKICIVKSKNKKAEYLKQYIKLIKDLRDTTDSKSEIKFCNAEIDSFENRNKQNSNQQKIKTCKQIMLIALKSSNGELRRKELLNAVRDTHSLSTFRKEIKRMASDGLVTLEGSNNSINQIIRIVD